MEPVEFLEELIRCYSPSGEEGMVASRAVEVMQSLGLRNARVDGVGNAIGEYGAENGPAVMLLGHIDTVPGEIEIRKEHEAGKTKLFGRGSVDAKGPFATFVQAVSKLPSDIPIRLIVVGAVEEEVRSSKGAREILRTLQQPEFVIIGEPSGGDGITLGYKGRLLQEVKLSREMAHSASKFLSIGDYLSLWASEVHRKVQLKNGEKAPGFRSLDCTVQQLRVSDDGMREEGFLELGFRLGPEYDPHQLAEELSTSFSQWIEARSEDVTLQAEAQCCQFEVPAEYSRKSPLAGAFRQAIRSNGNTPRHVLKTGTSDMNVLASEWSCPMVAYGPGDSDLDHTPHEHIVVEEYLLAIDVLAAALLSLSKKLVAA